MIKAYKEMCGLPIERKEQPDCIMESVEYLHIPLFEESRISIFHERSTQEMGMILPDMANLYRNIMTRIFYF